MEFCPRCGKPLKKSGELMVCDCGFSKACDSQISFTEKINQQTPKGKGVAEKKIEEGGFVHKCDKCGYMYSEVVSLGAFYSDESDVHLFKCKKCGHPKREAYGSSN